MLRIREELRLREMNGQLVAQVDPIALVAFNLAIDLKRDVPLQMTAGQIGPDPLHTPTPLCSMIDSACTDVNSGLKPLGESTTVWLDPSSSTTMTGGPKPVGGGYTSNLYSDWASHLMTGNYTRRPQHPSRLAYFGTLAKDVLDGGGGSFGVTADKSRPAYLDYTKLNYNYAASRMDAGDSGEERWLLRGEERFAPSVQARLKWELFRAIGELAGNDYFTEPFDDKDKEKDIHLRSMVVNMRAAALVATVTIQPLLIVYHCGLRALENSQVQTSLQRRIAGGFALNEQWEADNGRLAGIPVAPWASEVIRWFGTAKADVPFADGADVLTLLPELARVLITTNGTTALSPEQLLTPGSTWARVRAQLLSLVSVPEVEAALEKVGALLNYKTATGDAKAIKLWNPEPLHHDSLHLERTVAAANLPGELMVAANDHYSEDLDAKRVVPENEYRTIAIIRDSSLPGDTSVIFENDPRLLRPSDEYRGDANLLVRLELTTERMATIAGIPTQALEAEIRAPETIGRWSHLFEVKGAKIVPKAPECFKSPRTVDTASGEFGSYLTVPCLMPRGGIVTIEGEARAVLPIVKAGASKGERFNIALPQVFVGYDYLMLADAGTRAW